MSGLNRETFIRIVSAVVALPILVFLIVTDMFMAFPILIASSVISLITLYEYYMISDRGDAGRPFLKTGILFGLLLNVVMFLYAYGKPLGFFRYSGDFDARLIMFLFALFIAVLLVLQLFTRQIKGGTYSIAVTLFGVLYIVLSMSHIILLRSMKDGVFYIIILLVAVMLNDTGAYFGGVLFGKHKAGFEASPNKSWEGYFTGLLVCILGFILANQVCVSFFSRDLFSMLECTILGIIVSFFANTGDLIESAVKRDGGYKDSGSIIPGHGGMWDVFDATIFALPFFYYYLVFKGIP